MSEGDPADVLTRDAFEDIAGASMVTDNSTRIAQLVRSDAGLRRFATNLEYELHGSRRRVKTLVAVATRAAGLCREIRKALPATLAWALGNEHTDGKYWVPRLQELTSRAAELENEMSDLLGEEADAAKT
jgi:hypothetical protein